MSIEYQTTLGKDSEFSLTKLYESLKIDPELIDFNTLYMQDIHTAYRYGMNKGSEVTNRTIMLGQIAESFFHKFYLCYAVSLNEKKVKEAMELMYRFSKCCDIEGDDWIKHQDKVIEEMRDF